MKKPLPVDPASDTLDREARVRTAAYFEYQRKGCVDGCALDDWLTAEAQVGAEPATPQPAAARRPAARKGGRALTTR